MFSVVEPLKPISQAAEQLWVMSFEYSFHRNLQVSYRSWAVALQTVPLMHTPQSPGSEKER